jgi:DNA-binding transcriptional LysR family regulator
VRVSANEIVGAEILPPILTSLRERHPELELELILSNEVENLFDAMPISPFAWSNRFMKRC